MSSGSDGSTPGGDDERYLDAAGRDWGYDTILTVNLVTCTLSVVGALIMIIPFCLSKQLRKLRHQLILGMAVNDLLQSLSVLIPSAWAESHGPLAQNSPGCNADSFFYLTFVVAGCFWTLAIAMTTYITLVHPLSKTAEYMHRTKAVYVLWIGIWGTSVINAAVGAALNDSVDGGGFCFFPMVPPYLYGNLVLFIPRAATFTVIIGTYAALWYFFRRQASTHQRQESGLHDGTFELRMPHPFAAALSENSQPWASDQSDSRRGSGKTLNNEESDKTGINGERMALDGLDYRGLQERLVAYRFGKCPEFPVFQATPESDSTVGAEPVRIVKGRSESEAPDSTLERNIPLKRTQSKPLQDSSQILDSPGGFEHQLSLLGLSSAATGASNEDINVERPCLVRPSAAMSHWEEGISPGATLVDSVDGTSVSGRGGDVTWLQLRSPLSEHAALDENRPQKISAGHGKKVERMSTEMSMGLWEALGSVDPDHTRDANLATAYRDQGRRLSASEENRRVSYLMLLYPLVYSIVLAFSIARLIITLIIKAHPSPWLQLLNRLLILGTGVFDACIYTIIEWRFRASSQAAARTSFSKSESQSRRASASA